MKEILKKSFSSLGWDKIALLVVLAGLIWTNLYYKFWTNPRRIIVHDVILYYEYLPGVFIHNDITMSFVAKDPALYKDKIWTKITPTGRSVSKMTMGLAVLYAPFFLAAHGLAEPLGYAPDGFSDPYRFALILSSVFYATLGFWLLLKLLRKYFARNAIAISLLAIGLGTNLYFYTTIEPPMSHAYSFFLYAAFMYAVDSWSAKPSWGNSALTGLVGGMIILVRPTNGIIFILLPLWQVDSLSALLSRLKLFLNKSMKLIMMAIIAILVFIPQIIYWKYVTGDYFYYSYGDERFFFNAGPVFLPERMAGLYPSYGIFTGGNNHPFLPSPEIFLACYSLYPAKPLYHMVMVVLVVWRRLRATCTDRILCLAFNPAYRIHHLYFR
jgi:hypothetical protein